MRFLIVSVLTLGLLTGTVTAQEVAARNGAKADVTNGEVVVRFAEKKGEWPPAVGIAGKPEGVAGKSIVLEFEAKSAASLPVRAVISDFAPPYSHLSPAQTINLGTAWQAYSLTFAVSATSAAKINLPLLVFESSPTSGEVRFRNIKTSAPVAAPAAPAVERKWKAIDTTNLFIKPGSALDFAPFFDQAVAGAYGRLTVNKNGEFAFASKPDAPVRFFSVQLMPPPDFTLWTDEDVAQYAAAITRQGYNLVRFHFFDNLINGNFRAAPLKANLPSMERYTLPEKPEEIQFDVRALDRFHLLLAELKKRGVYWNLDFMTSFVGYSNGKLQSAPKQGGFNTKAQMYVNPNFRANWKAAVTRLLNDVNPYTKQSIKNDPALALTTCLNEPEILFEQRNYGHEFDGPWHAFLTKKYGDYKKMREAWEGKCGTTVLPENGTFADVPPIGAPTVLTDTPAGRDMAQCCGGMEYEMAQWYLATLRELNFPGLVSNYNMRTRIGTVPARSLYPVITMNGYHAHPQFGERTTVSQNSSLAGGGDSFKSQALARFLDRPFANTEFGIVFWNPYRHEQGMLYGVGGALQNWSALTCHAEQVVDAGATLRYFNAGDDPVIRASETIEALAFRRGDIASSPHTIEIPLTDEFIYGGRAMKALDDELSRLWVLCRVGITYGTKKVDYPKVFAVSPDKMAAIGGSIWFSEVAKSTSTTQLSAIVAKLKEMKALPADNESNPAQGVLQSDTGEVTLNTKSGGEMFVHAPRFEGAVVKSDKKVKLDALTIDQSTVPASITMTSLDLKKTLRDANRLLLVFSTDARNTNMTFTDAKEDKVISLGTLPVLARTGELKVTLTRAAAPKKVTVYALKLNGERADEVPATISGNTIALAIDTEKLPKAGPTPFFELVVE
ncbi:MAG: hypothetical protein B9S32_06980 [Verrucomicrobia bacterium Tous-C9LFEB]|nr:MAG: hypothetical protein B9S32_06980 [Verrucomicrobia bacterium Tous-C9LFEB]